MMEDDGYTEEYEEAANYTDGYQEDAYEEIEFVETDEE